VEPSAAVARFPARPPPLHPKPRTNPYFTPFSSSTSSSSREDSFGPFASYKPVSATPAAVLKQSSYVNLAVNADLEASPPPVGDVNTEEIAATASPPAPGFLLPLARSQTLPHLLQKGSAPGGKTFSAMGGSISEELDLFGRSVKPSLSPPPQPSSNPFFDTPSVFPLPVSKPPARRPTAVSFAGDHQTSGRNPFRVPLSQIPALEPGDTTRQLGELFFARLLLTAASSSGSSSSSSSSSSSVPRVIPTNISDPLAVPTPPPTSTLPPLRKSSQVPVQGHFFLSWILVLMPIRIRLRIRTGSK